MGDFGKDILGIVTLLIGVAVLALLVGHAAGAGYLIQQSSTGLNTLLNTVELTPTSTNGPGTSATNNVIGGVFGGSGGSSGGSFAIALPGG